MKQVQVYGLDGKEHQSYFGVCPTCGKCDGYINVGASHWFYCKEHKVCWCVGANLFSDWKEETLEEQEHIYNELGFGSFKQLKLDEVGDPDDFGGLNPEDVPEEDR